jgi:hypothetical protein
VELEEAYHAVSAFGRSGVAYFGAGPCVGKAAGPAVAIGGFKGDLLGVLESLTFIASVPESGRSRNI